MANPAATVAEAAERQRGAEEMNPATGRLGRAEEVAATALFLCSDGASNIHGSAIAVDGGLQGGKQFRHPLDLVEHGLARQIRHEAHGIGLRRSAQHIVVKAQIGKSRRIPHRTREGGLAALARSMHQHGG